MSDTKLYFEEYVLEDSSKNEKKYFQINVAGLTIDDDDSQTPITVWYSNQVRYYITVWYSNQVRYITIWCSSQVRYYITVWYGNQVRY